MSDLAAWDRIIQANATRVAHPARNAMAAMGVTVRTPAHTMLGGRMQGGKRNDALVPRKADDFYRTPSSATYALVQALDQWIPDWRGDPVFPTRTWEPCCGDGRMVRDLLANGIPCYASDLVDRGYGYRHDLLGSGRSLNPAMDLIRPTGEVPPFDWLITNPPWNLAEEIIKHCRGQLQAIDMALLLKTTFFCPAERLAMFKLDPPAFQFQLTWRLDFEDLGKPVLECSWFVWHGITEYGNTRIIPIECPEGFKRSRKHDGRYNRIAPELRRFF